MTTKMQDRYAKYKAQQLEIANARSNKSIKHSVKTTGERIPFTISRKGPLKYRWQNRLADFIPIPVDKL